jgi:glutamate carboxypeptidase
MEKIYAAIEAKKDQMLAFLQQLVDIDSALDNPEGIKKCAHLIGDKMAALGLAVEYFDYPGVCTHVLGKKAGKGGKSIMISGHTDTVFLTGTTKERPFRIADGKAFGPGVADMKGGIAMALFVLEAMYEQGWDDKGVTMFFCGDEETGHPKSDAPAIYAREGAGKTAVFCLEPGRPGGEVVTGRKGVVIPEMRITGLAAHAMEPHKGVSAVHEMALLINDIMGLQDIDKGILCNVGVANGGSGASVVAEHAAIRFSIRFNKIAEGEAILQSLRRMAASPHIKGATVELLDDRFLYQPYETTDKVEKLLAFVREQGRKVGIAEIGAVFQAGGSDACWTANAGAPTLCGMGPVGGFFHNDREYISIDGLLQRANLLAACIAEI